MHFGCVQRKTLDESTLREAIVDLDKLENPARGGFNLLYNDGYFAQSLNRKWGMDTAELGKRVKDMKKKMGLDECPKIRPSSKDKCGICGSTKLNDLGHKTHEGTVICLSCGGKWWKRWYTKLEFEDYVNNVDGKDLRQIELL